MTQAPYLPPPRHTNEPSARTAGMSGIPPATSSVLAPSAGGPSLTASPRRHPRSRLPRTRVKPRGHRRDLDREAPVLPVLDLHPAPPARPVRVGEPLGDDPSRPERQTASNRQAPSS